MTSLSPAARAMLDAYEDSSMSASLDGVDRGGLAAALRALAVRVKGADDIRQDILALAAELEAE
jgi:hypothetical protein